MFGSLKGKGDERFGEMRLEEKIENWWEKVFVLDDKGIQCFNSQNQGNFLLWIKIKPLEPLKVKCNINENMKS